MKKLLTIITMFVFGFLLTGCDGGSNDPIAVNDTVTIVYDATYEDGIPFVTQKEETFTVGEQEALVIFEQEVLGMKKGEVKEILATPDKAYGKDYDANKVQKLAVQIFNQLNYPVEIGKTYRIGDIKGTIKGTEGEGGNQVVIFDINEPETFKNIIFKITIKKVVKAKE